jgi:hypothetical protein
MEKNPSTAGMIQAAARMKSDRKRSIAELNRGRALLLLRDYIETLSEDKPA